MGTINPFLSRLLQNDIYVKYSVHFRPLTLLQFLHLAYMGHSFIFTYLTQAFIIRLANALNARETTMKRKLTHSIMLTLLFIVLITGCTPRSDMSTDDILASLNGISSLDTKCKADSMTPKDKILINESIVGLIKQTGLLNTKWTVSIQDTDLFYVKYVTNEEINDLENVISSTTFGCYDMNNTCLGYCQERVYTDKNYCYVFLNPDYSEVGYYADDACDYLYSKDNSEAEYTISYKITDHYFNKYDVNIVPTDSCTLKLPLQSKIFLQIIKANEACRWL